MEKKKIKIIPYLAFMGNCEEAVHTYIEAFGGEIYGMSRWSENTFETTPEQIGKVMHIEFALGNTRMAAGDSFDCSEANAAIRLMIHMDSEKEALYAVSVLAKGGTVLSPLQPHPEPDDSGCGSIIKDRFGFAWIITCPNPHPVKRG
ncbi:VOC family protein [Acetatifactor muris]|uniref:3-demethylubiquinone-9 3-methyltransferase n=1 Tax=Acetatifactor muris TaxID=879566 RepID=A0A2K4ZHF9_9FIRM|nr:VOC family protein [Acetatifactor muris]MCR2048016.1 VOC family protein [Acetatifactor muris]SOY29909.1 3-demethylubiquinone-9 3-methyltransferase [Acetatifactor muris]